MDYQSNNMNKILFTITIITALTVFLVGCSKYNFNQLFPFDSTLYRRAIKLQTVNGYSCDLSKKNFLKLKVQLISFFSQWKKLDNGCVFHSNGIMIDNTYFGKSSRETIYSIRNDFDIDGRIPVIIYFEKQEKMIFFIADDGML